MEVLNSTLQDLSNIFDLYKTATEYIKSKNQAAWPTFSKNLIITEIKENRQWKLLIDGKIACIWATTLNDELIWGSKNNIPSLYIHRIAAHQDFRGQNLVKILVTWANEFGKNQNLTYLRLDTVGLNIGLIKHYKKMGFEFLGSEKLKNTEGLPSHYAKGPVCYFQKDII